MTKHNFSKCLTSKHANTNTSLVKVVDMPIMCYIFKSLWHKDFKINVPECLMFKYTNNCSAGFPFNTGSSAVEHLVTFLKYEGSMFKSFGPLYWKLCFLKVCTDALTPLLNLKKWVGLSPCIATRNPRCCMHL